MGRPFLGQMPPGRQGRSVGPAEAKSSRLAEFSSREKPPDQSRGNQVADADQNKDRGGDRGKGRRNRFLLTPERAHKLAAQGEAGGESAEGEPAGEDRGERENRQ